ncbi:MAG: hypothetical protein ABTQ29_08130 [Siculibacillus sp.]
MDVAVVAVALETAVLLAIVAVFVLVMRRLRRRAVGGVPLDEPVDDVLMRPAGDWGVLAARFAVDRPADDPIAERATVMVGPTVWRNCVRVGIGADGLALAVRTPIFGAFGKKPIRIPWSAVVATAPTTLHWGAARMLTIGRPPLATVTLPLDLWAEIDRAGHLAIPA